MSYYTLLLLTKISGKFKFLKRDFEAPNTRSAWFHRVAFRL